MKKRHAPPKSESLSPPPAAGESEVHGSTPPRSAPSNLPSPSPQAVDITFDCPHCGSELVVASEGAASTVDCPVCGVPVTIPDPPPPSAVVPSPETVLQEAAADAKRRRRRRRPKGTTIQLSPRAAWTLVAGALGLAAGIVLLVRFEPSVTTRTSAQALREIEARAGQGDTGAMVDLGRIHMQETGWGRSPSTGVEWFRRAQTNGSTEAEFLLAECYRRGIGLDRDLNTARTLLDHAATQGHQTAQYTLALALFEQALESQGTSSRPAMIEAYRKATFKGPRTLAAVPAEDMTRLRLTIWKSMNESERSHFAAREGQTP